MKTLQKCTLCFLKVWIWVFTVENLYYIMKFWHSAIMLKKKRYEWNNENLVLKAYRNLLKWYHAVHIVFKNFNVSNELVSFLIIYLTQFDLMSMVLVVTNLWLSHFVCVYCLLRFCFSTISTREICLQKVYS